MEEEAEEAALPESASEAESGSESGSESELEPEPEPEPEDDEGVVAILKEGKSWYLTALLVFLLAAVALVIYLAKVKSMDFLYALF